MKLNRCWKALMLLCVLSFTNCLTVQTDEAINISEFKMKHKKSHMRAKNNAADPGCSSNTAVNSNSPAGGQDPNSPGFQPPILFSAWIKYFKYPETALTQGQTAPTSFFRNNQFFQQARLFPGADLTAKSFDGTSTLNDFIQDETSFYIKVFKNTINFISSRKVHNLSKLDRSPTNY